MKTKFLSILIFIICISNSNIAIAQNNAITQHDLTLPELGTNSASAALNFTSNNRLHGIHKLLFNKVVVFDDRFGTTKYTIVKDIGTFIIGTFDKPASEAIKII